MVKTGVTVLDATREWVGQFNAIPQSVVEKLAELNIDSIHEITPPSKHDRVYIADGEHQGEEGEILRVSDDDDEVYVVELDGSREEVEISQDDFEVQNDGFLPMWGTMWTFGESIDDGWLDHGDGLQAMADCGFRIYESDDFGYIFGIDGAGYDFYEAHWVPLYHARGLQWHDDATEDAPEDIEKKLLVAITPEQGRGGFVEKLLALSVGETLKVGGYFGGHLTDRVIGKHIYTAHLRTTLDGEVVILADNLEEAKEKAEQHFGISTAIVRLASPTQDAQVYRI